MEALEKQVKMSPKRVPCRTLGGGHLIRWVLEGGALVAEWERVVGVGGVAADVDNDLVGTARQQRTGAVTARSQHGHSTQSHRTVTARSQHGHSTVTARSRHGHSTDLELAVGFAQHVLGQELRDLHREVDACRQGGRRWSAGGSAGGWVGVGRGFAG